ncbi:cell envelope integrity protein TolA [Vibrio hippocampi]|uniref:Protein TolA n=1 Tax=Vibrio hippocampi TaxID=654686 RepID=A0ABN8DJJ9_9VIBR|nr:cell envelope integrity protein TolA [Vibrio hippocampi]CAH0526313.1 hypothetical protein VHP8226_01738 [Vibrio hippocampi]
MKNKNKQNNSYLLPVMVSLGAHAVLMAALLWGTDFTMEQAEPTGMVEAVVIDPAQVRQQAAEIRKQRETAAKKEQDRLDKLRRESEQLERNRKEEEERIRKLKQQQAQDAQAAREAEKRREVERKRAVEAETERKIQEEAVRKAEQQRKEKEAAIARAEKERIAKEAAVAKAEQERIAKEKALKEAQEKAQREKEAAERAEQERIAKEKAAAEAAEKARQEQLRLDQLERERQEKEAALNDIFSGLESEAAANSTARSRFVSSEVQRMGAIYTQLIQQNLLLEDSFRGKECKVNLRLIPAGKDAVVGNVSIIEGESRLCSAAKRAIAKVGSFPLSTDADVNSQLKNINLTVVP